MRYFYFILILLIASCDNAEILIPGGEFYSYEGGIPAARIREAIDEQIPGTAWHVFLGDPAYRSYSKSDVERFMLLDNTDRIPYRSHAFDCEDFATVFAGRIKLAYPGIPCGVMWCVYYSDRQIYIHAFNVFYDGFTGRVHILDAQLDAFREPQIIAVFLVVI